MGGDQEALKLLDEALSVAYAAVQLAESIADRAGLEFTMDIGGYGMGGTYYSEKYVEEHGSRYTTAGWNASSESC